MRINQQLPEQDIIIPIFIPHAGCSHRCIFCNQTGVTGKAVQPIDPGWIKDAVKTYLPDGFPKNRRMEPAFYGGNFLGLPKKDIRCLLDAAMTYIDNGTAASIRFSTRPDTITQNRLEFIRSYPVKTIEIGVQSMDDAVLEASGRGHTAADTIRAVRLLKAHHYQTGLQMMAGLPGETESSAIDTALAISRLGPDFVRIYPTLVLENSRLASWFRRGKYHPLSLTDAVKRVKLVFLVFQRHHIPVIRMGLQATADLDSGAAVLAGPYHPAFGHMVWADLFKDAMVKALTGRSERTNHVTVRVHPKSISRLQGIRKKNLDMIQERFGPGQLSVLTDPSLDKNALSVGDDEPISVLPATVSDKTRNTGQ